MAHLSKQEQLIGIAEVVGAINNSLSISATPTSACVMVWDHSEAMALERALWNAGHTNTFMRHGQYIDAWFLIIFYT